jgi:hypothetical protein
LRVASPRPNLPSRRNLLNIRRMQRHSGKRATYPRLTGQR